jgi:hypothetical protein
MTSQYTITTGRPQAVRSPRSLLATAGRLCAVGGLVGAAGAVVTAAVHGSVSSSRESYPYSPGLSQLLQTVWTVASLLVLIGVVGLARAQRPLLVGSSRLGRVGVRIAVVAMTLLVPCEFSFVFVAH